MIRTDLQVAKNRLARLASRRRMSLDDLATVFLASGACPEVPRDVMERARGIVTVGMVDSINIGPTFGDTVSLNRPFLDLYEADGRHDEEHKHARD